MSVRLTSPPGMVAIGLTRALRPLYEQFTRSFQHSLAWHSLGYHDVLLDTLGCEDRYIVAIDRPSGRVTGVLPLLEKDGVLNSLPYFGTNGGVLGGPETDLLATYEELAMKARAATMIGQPLTPSLAQPVHTHRVDRQGQMTRFDEKEMTVHPSAWQNFRRAERAGVTVHRAPGRYALDALGYMARQTAKNANRPVRKKAWFDAVAQYMDYDVWTATLDDQMVAGLLVLYHGEFAHYVVPEQLQEYRTVQPMAAILGHAMLYAANQRNVKFWDWGGSPQKDGGVARFKRKWGGFDTEYSYYVQVNDEKLWNAKPELLRVHWPGFYVRPFIEEDK